MSFEALKDRVKEIEYRYWLDKTELGKVTLIASLSITVVSLHALYSIDSAVEHAEDSKEQMQQTSALVASEGFQQSMNALAQSGATIDGQPISEVVSELQYAADSVESVEQTSQELEDARRTYQWTLLIGILGLVGGLTAIYI